MGECVSKSVRSLGESGSKIRISIFEFLDSCYAGSPVETMNFSSHSEGAIFHCNGKICVYFIVG
jgi:hypothetical protein